MISEPCYWVLRCDNQFVVATDEAGGKVFPRGSTSDFGSDGTPLLIGTWQDLPCYAYELDPTPNPSLPGELTLLRPLYGLAGAEAFALAGRASQLLDWKRNHRHCGRSRHGGS